MGESDLHKYLKLLGIKYLDKQGCRLITTEIYVRKSSSDFWLNGDTELEKRAEHYNQYLDGMEAHLKKNHGSDSKWIIDILGIGEKNIMSNEDTTTPHGTYRTRKKVGTEITLRGIEVKVSRNDFLNGYAQTGLHFHYLLTPELLVKKSEIPKHVGLLYWKKGDPSVYCVKRPRRMELNKNMIEVYIKSIYQRYHSQIMSMTRDQLKLLREKVMMVGVEQS